MTPEQAETTIERAIETSDVVRVAPGGRLVYWDTEQGSGIGLYSTVARIIANQWGRKRLGLRDIQVARPPHGRTKSDGVWTRPDLVVAAYPRKRASVNDPKDLHALEVERQSGFDVRSVYQAYEQGRGARFVWVFAHVLDVDKRVVAAAKDLDVGVVSFTNPNAVATYTTAVWARKQGTTSDDAAAFMKRCSLSESSKLTGWSATNGAEAL